ncbi:hypothetical protein [Nonomuraea sp. NPDC050786]|uniref:hypothetical protein n=1 Tax=Nonomuraea sp. NPDC050786 TaxID=3154840 RepID=UPI0033E9418A
MYVDEHALDRAMDRERPDSLFCLHSIAPSLEGVSEEDGSYAIRMRLGGHWTLPDAHESAVDSTLPDTAIHTIDMVLNLDAAALAGEELGRLTSQGIQAQIDQELGDQ